MYCFSSFKKRTKLANFNHFKKYFWYILCRNILNKRVNNKSNDSEKHTVEHLYCLLHADEKKKKIIFYLFDDHNFPVGSGLFTASI